MPIAHDDNDERADVATASEDTIEAEIQKWRDKLKAVADEAAQHGFTAFVMVVGFDPLKRESFRCYGYEGNFYEVVAGLQLTVREYSD